MKNILIDTNAYAAFKRGNAEAVEIIQRAPTIGINSIVIGELLAGFISGKHAVRNRQELKRFLDSPRVILLPITDDTANYYANIYLNLRSKGKPIPTNDMWIAASTLQHSFSLFTYDDHFMHIDGLLTGASLMDFIQNPQ